MRDSRGATGAIARRAIRERRGTDAGALGPAPSAMLGPGAADLVVCASGNLALVYFRFDEGRLTDARLEELHPGLIGALVAHPGIGLVMMRTGAGHAVAIGARGRRDLATGTIDGEDPTADYGGYAVESLVRLDAMEHVGDVVLISVYDPDTEEVAAFEELIGSHGGIGGAQTQAFVLHPRDWVVDAPMVGAPAVYRQLRRWLSGLGIELGKPAPAALQPDGVPEAVVGDPAPVPEAVGVASGPTSGVPRA